MRYEAKSDMKKHAKVNSLEGKKYVKVDVKLFSKCYCKRVTHDQLRIFGTNI